MSSKIKENSEDLYDLERPNDLEDAERSKDKTDYFEENLRQETDIFCELQEALRSKINIKNRNFIYPIEKETEELSLHEFLGKYAESLKKIKSNNEEIAQILSALSSSVDEMENLLQFLEKIKVDSLENASDMREIVMEINKKILDGISKLDEFHHKNLESKLEREEKLVGTYIYLPGVKRKNQLKGSFYTEKSGNAYYSIRETQRKLKGFLFFKPGKKKKELLNQRLQDLETVQELRKISSDEFEEETNKEAQNIEEKLIDIRNKISKIVKKKATEYYLDIFREIESLEKDNLPELSGTDWLNINLKYIENSKAIYYRLSNYVYKISASLSDKIKKNPETKKVLDKLFATIVTAGREDLSEEDLSELTKERQVLEKELLDVLESQISELDPHNATHVELRDNLCEAMDQYVNSQKSVKTQHQDILSATISKEDTYFERQNTILAFLKEHQSIAQVDALYRACQRFSEIDGRSQKIYERASEIEQLLKKVPKHFDIDLWLIIKNLWSAEQIEKAEAFLSKVITKEIISIRTKNPHSEDAKSQAEYLSFALMRLKRPELVPFYILNAYEHVGSSGIKSILCDYRQPSPLADLLQSLTEEDLAFIRESIPSELGEATLRIVEVIRENPENFYQPFIEDPKISEFKKLFTNDPDNVELIKRKQVERSGHLFHDAEYLAEHIREGNYTIEIKEDKVIVEIHYGYMQMEDMVLTKDEFTNLLRKHGMRDNLLSNTSIDNPVYFEIKTALTKMLLAYLKEDKEPYVQYAIKFIISNLDNYNVDIELILNSFFSLPERVQKELKSNHLGEMMISKMIYSPELRNGDSLDIISAISAISVEDLTKFCSFLDGLCLLGHTYEDKYINNYLELALDQNQNVFLLRLCRDYRYYFSAKDEEFEEFRLFYESSDRDQILELFTECLGEMPEKQGKSFLLGYRSPLRLLNEQSPERKNAFWQLVAELEVYNYEFDIVTIPLLIEFLDSKDDLFALIPRLVKIGYSFALQDTISLKSLLEEKKAVVSVAEDLEPYGYKFETRDICRLDEINNIFVNKIREKDQVLQLVNNLRRYGYKLNLDDFINGKLIKVFKVQEAFIADLSQQSETSNSIMLKGDGKQVKMPYDQKINNTVAGYKSSNTLEGIESDLGQEKLAEMQAWEKVAVLFALIENQEITLSPEVTDKIRTYFKAEENMDFCLTRFQTEWLEFLEQGKPTFSREINELNSIISEHGIGHLRLVESISTLMKNVKELVTDQKTRQEIRQGFLSQEKRFAAERWSNQEKAVFYDISSDILEISASLYPDFLEVIAGLDRTELEIFSTELLPLFHAQLIILEKTDQQGKTYYSGKDLVRAVREKLRDLKDSLGLEESRAKRVSILEGEKRRLIEVIKSSFKERFGILKVPEIFDKDKVKILTDLVRYLGNIHERNEQKEKVWTLLLAARLNEQWAALRRGEELAIEDLLVPEKAQEVKNILANRKSFETITAANLNIEEESLPKFQTILQEEVSTLMLGQIETVDIKLGNIIRNLDELQDADIYLEQERVLFDLAQRFGNKKINAVLAKKYRNLTGKEDSWDGEDQKILEELSLNFVLDQAQQIKPLQDQFAPVASVFALNNGITSFQIEKEIADLQQKLLPPTKVVEIINRISDEEFTAQSGALAVTSDVMYLREVVAKRQNELNDEEKKTIGEYLTKVENQVVKLERILQKIRKDFAKAAKQIEKSQSPALVARLKEAEKFVMGEGSAALEFTTKMTGDLKVVIENIRACLGCLTKQCNNDTNLTFADSNRFLLTSHAVGKEGSFADQLVFLLPVIEDNDRQESAFVMDNVYGHKVADVLLGHLQAVYKKYQTLKQETPKAKLSIFVTQAALTSVGLSADILKQRLKASFAPEAEIVPAEKVKVTVPQSAFGDYYIEFGGGSRTTEERTVSGLMIR